MEGLTRLAPLAESLRGACAAPATVWRPGPDSDYRLFPRVRQPHLQFVDWHRHAPSGHPQEQLAQSQAPQQVVVAAVWSGVFFRFVIVFSSVFLERLMRFQSGRRASTRNLTALSTKCQTDL